MALRRSAGTHKRARSHVDWTEMGTKYAGTAMRWAAPVFAAAAGYYVYALFSGALSANADARVVSNMQLTGEALALAGAVATLGLIIVTMEEAAWSVLAGVVALALTFGGPALCLTARVDPSWPVARVILHWSALAGHLMLGIVAVRILMEIVIQVRDAPRRRAEEQARLEAEGPKRTKKAVGVWSKCWDLPYCHDTVKENCPAFKVHKTCWKHGLGCNCDIGMIESLIRSGASLGKGGAKDSAKKATANAYIRSDLEADVVPGAGIKTIPCTKCPIYNEHQRQKFRIVNPIAVAGTLIGLALLFQPMTALYQATIQALSRAAAQMTLTGSTNAQEWFGYLDTPAVRIFFFIVVGLLLLSYVLKAVEWAILEKKW